MTPVEFTWINVEVELPPNTIMGQSDEVLCASGESVFLAYYDYSRNMWTDDRNPEIEIVGITHWGFLPPPPRK